jgi:bisphosphoglycerate-independent phosphoglycerate mutase (AlkP superfamily)
MTNIELAKWLHDNYEAVAKEQDWNTQQSCKVEFDTLPDANKRTMIEIADRLLNFNLLRLHFVVGRSEQFYCASDKDNRYDRCEEQCHLCKMNY